MNDKYMRTDIRLKRAVGEVIALKGRIEKMKTTSFQRMQVKLCTRCHKEYNEKENYNWSCRTHQSTYGGTMWWCCGRRNKDDPGCKYSKHQITEAEEDGILGGGSNDGVEYDEDGNVKAKINKQKTENIRCFVR